MRLSTIACCTLLLLAGVSLAAPAAPALPARGQPLGTWRGSAVLAGARLDLSVRIFREQGVLRATMSSPDLLLLEQPLKGVEHAGRHVRFATPDEDPLRFKGILLGDSIHGSALVPAVPGVVSADRESPSLHFALGRARAAPAPPYATREVRISNGPVRLAATLYMPAGAGRHPGVVLLQGSSSNLRREYTFYADHFARAGLAVLAFDKRGKGGSTGDYAAATYEQLASDAAAAVELLREQRGVDSTRVGVWGLSQGAYLAPLVAAQVPGLRFLVGVSAPGLPIGESVAYQDSMRLAAAGFDAADIRRTVSLDRRLNAWLRDGRDRAELSALLAEAANTPWRRASSLPTRIPQGAALDGWYWRGRMQDPAPAWRAVQVPVLVVYGAADELLPAKANAKAVKHALKRGGNRDVTVRTYPAANHVIRTLPRVAGGKWDWPRAAPGYMGHVTSWILEHVR